MSDTSNPFGFEIDFNGNPGIEQFNSVKDVNDFVLAEVNSWRSFFYRIDSGASFIGPSMNGLFQTMRKIQLNMEAVAQSFPETMKIKELQNQARGLLGPYIQGKLFHSRSTIGIYLLNENIPILNRIGYFLYFLSDELNASDEISLKNILVQTQGTYSPAVISGIVSAMLQKEGASALFDVEMQKLQNLEASFTTVVNTAKVFLSDVGNQVDKSSEFKRKSEAAFNDFLSDGTQKLVNFWEDGDKKLSAMLQDHKTKYEDIEKSFNKKMKLRAPCKYWQDAAELHRKRSNSWFLYFLFLVVVAISGIVWVGEKFVNQCNFLNGDKGIDPLLWFVLGVPTVLLLWIVRSSHRQWMTHVGLARVFF